MFTVSIMVSMLKLSNSTEKLEFITISPAQPTAHRGEENFSVESHVAFNPSNFSTLRKL